jgi:hypothetical protein
MYVRISFLPFALHVAVSLFSPKFVAQHLLIALLKNKIIRQHNYIEK